jgi:YVTN family beta-propeller protein
MPRRGTKRPEARSCSLLSASALVAATLVLASMASFDHETRWAGTERPTSLSVQEAALASRTGFAIAADSTPESVISTIDVGDFPTGTVLDPEDGHLFVDNANSNNLSVISTATDSVVATIPLQGSAPVFDSSDSEVYVTGPGCCNVSAINTSTNLVMATIPTGEVAGDYPALNPFNGTLYYPSYSGKIWVIAPSNNSVVGTVNASQENSKLLFDPYNLDLYVPLYPAHVMAVFNSSNYGEVTAINLTGASGTPAVDPANGRIYAALGYPSENLSIIDASTNKVIDTLSVCEDHDTPVYDSATGGMLVPCDGASPLGPGNLTVVSTSSDLVVTHVGVGFAPDSPVLDGDSGDFYVPNSDGTVTILSGSTYHVLDTLQLNALIAAVTYAPANGRIYVTDAAGNRVLVIGQTTGPQGAGWDYLIVGALVGAAVVAPVVVISLRRRRQGRHDEPASWVLNSGTL